MRGAATASAIAFSVGTLLAIASLLRPGSALRLGRHHLRPNLGIVRRIAAVGSPTGMEQLLMQIGFLIYLSIAARYGTAAVAAYFIGVRILALSFLPGFGFALVGRRLYLRQRARQLGSAES